jgi:hypothetical protein
MCLIILSGANEYIEISVADLRLPLDLVRREGSGVRHFQSNKGISSSIFLVLGMARQASHNDGNHPTCNTTGRSQVTQKIDRNEHIGRMWVVQCSALWNQRGWLASSCVEGDREVVSFKSGSRKRETMG